MKRIKYVYFYFLFLLYLIVGFFGDVPFISKGIYENLYNYVGLMLIPTLLFFVLYGFVFMIKNKKRRFFWELRLYYIYIISFVVVYIFILSNLGINLNTAPTFTINTDFIRNLINKSLFEYKIGYLPTYLLYEFVNLSLRFKQIPFHYFYYGLYGLGFFISLLIVFGPFIRSINRAKEKRRIERKRAEMNSSLIEQFEIQEKLEKGEKMNTVKSERKTASIQKNSKKTKIETEAKVKEKIDKSGIVFRRTVTIKEDIEWY